MKEPPAIYDAQGIPIVVRKPVISFGAHLYNLTGEVKKQEQEVPRETSNV